jgi:general secretion pathway protein C
MRMEDLADKGTRAGAVAWLALTAGVTAWLIAYWFWQITLRPVPPPAIALESHPETLAQQVRSRALFGRGDAVVVPAVAAPAATPMTLVGIVSAANGKKGVAVIVVNGKKAVTARVGEEVAPGIVLSRIARDQVELTQDGRMINLMLSTKK